MRCNVDWWLNWQKLKSFFWPTRSRGALFDLVFNQSECCIMFWRKSIFHFQIMDFTMKSLRMRAKQSECCIMLWRKSIFHFWIMDFTMKSLTVSSNGRGVSREQNKISHGCADPSLLQRALRTIWTWIMVTMVMFTEPSPRRGAFGDPCIDKTLCIWTQRHLASDRWRFAVKQTLVF